MDLRRPQERKAHCSQRDLCLVASLCLSFLLYKNGDNNPDHLERLQREVVSLAQRWSMVGTHCPDATVISGGLLRAPDWGPHGHSSRAAEPGSDAEDEPGLGWEQSWVTETWPEQPLGGVGQ